MEEVFEPFEVTINRINISGKWIEFCVYENECRGERSFDFSVKYGDFVNGFTSEDQIKVLNIGLKGAKLILQKVGVNYNVIGVKI